MVNGKLKGHDGLYHTLVKVEKLLDTLDKEVQLI